MFQSLFTRSMLAAAALLGAVAMSAPAAEAKTRVHVWIGLPGFTYWAGPGYYYGRYRHRLSCAEGRRIVDHRGFNSVTATDCVPRIYHYKARRAGKWYTVRFDSVTARMDYWRR
jgi:hypothetical protein